MLKRGAVTMQAPSSQVMAPGMTLLAHQAERPLPDWAALDTKSPEVVLGRVVAVLVFLASRTPLGAAVVPAKAFLSSRAPLRQAVVVSLPSGMLMGLAGIVFLPLVEDVGRTTRPAALSAEALR